MLHQTLESTDETFTKAVETHERVTLTRDGDPIAVVLSIADYRSLEATAALAKDPENLRRALAAERRLNGTPEHENTP